MTSRVRTLCHLWRIEGFLYGILIGVLLSNFYSCVVKNKEAVVKEEFLHITITDGPASLTELTPPP